MDFFARAAGSHGDGVELAHVGLTTRCCVRRDGLVCFNFRI